MVAKYPEKKAPRSRPQTSLHSPGNLRRIIQFPVEDFRETWPYLLTGRQAVPQAGVVGSEACFLRCVPAFVGPAAAGRGGCPNPCAHPK